MKEDNVVELKGPEGINDAVTRMLKQGAMGLIKEAVEAEFREFLKSYEELRLEDGRKQVVRNGYLPEREIQTGIGGIPVNVPRCRDRDGGQIKFTSAILPRYLRRTRSVEELLPWLYLKGISTNNFQEALRILLGEGAQGLSASTIGRLKSKWQQECERWRKQDISLKRYVYFWADGIYCGIRGEDEKMCVLVILGVTETGEKELVALNDGYRESTESWLEVLRDLKERGLTQAPKLAIGDGALGFWKALAQVFPETKAQRCWQHKSANILNCFPKGMRGKALEAIHEIWMAPSKKEALKAWDRFVRQFKDKYPKAVACLEKDKQTMLTFYDFPAEHWKSIRSTNPIESIFASVRHRSDQAKGCVSRSTMLALVFMLIRSAQNNWSRLDGLGRINQLISGVKFIDGLPSSMGNKGIDLDDDNCKLAA